MKTVSSSVSLHAHSHAGGCGCGEHHSHVQIPWKQALLGLVLIVNAFLMAGLVKDSQAVADSSALLGAILLGFPILRTAFQGLWKGALNTNALVAMAVMALFASQHYQEAGIVSFFMLLGQIIEKRTAEGALASVESLIKLTPAKARRVLEDQEDEVAAHELAVGDLIRVRPGDHVAADGIILRGQGLMN